MLRPRLLKPGDFLLDLRWAKATYPRDALKGHHHFTRGVFEGMTEDVSLSFSFFFSFPCNNFSDSFS